MELIGYRERFPILASTTYLINHSLGAMPAEAARRLELFAHEWATRGARAWGEGWWDVAGSRRRPRRLDRRRAAGQHRHAPERDGRRGDRALVLRPEAAAQPDRLRGRTLPVGALRAAGVDALRRRGRRLRRRGGRDRRDRRADAARPGLARALQDRRDPADRARSSRARTRSARTSASTRTSRPARCRST